MNEDLGYLVAIVVTAGGSFISMALVFKQHEITAFMQTWGFM